MYRGWKRVAGLAMAAVLLAACGGGGDGGAEGGEPAEPADRVLRLALPTVISSVDHATYEGTPDTDMEPMWSAPYLQFVEPAEGELPGLDDVEPFLAESYEVEDDGRVRITLREVTSPFGNPVTSEDVQWTFQRQLELDTITKFLASIAQVDTANPIEIVDERTFRLNVAAPNPFSLAILTMYVLSPVDSTAAQENATPDDPWAQEWLTANATDSGPYLVESITPGEQIRLRANPDHFGDPAAFPEVVLQSVPEAANRLQLIASGEVDYAQALLPDQFASLQGNPDVQTEVRPSLTLVPLVLNTGFGPFSDPRVREAITLAIDRDALVEGPMSGFAIPAVNQLQSYLQQPTPPPGYERDLDRSRQLLAEAGYADGFAFTINLNRTRPGPFSEQLGVEIAAQLTEIGLDVEVDVVGATADFEEAKRANAYEAWIDTSTPILPDAWYAWSLVFHSEDAFSNFHGYANPRVDELLDQAKVEPIGPGRDAILAEIHEILMTDVPWVPLVQLNNLIAASPDVDLDTFEQFPPIAPRIHQLQPSS